MLRSIHGYYTIHYDSDIEYIKDIIRADTKTEMNNMRNHS